MEKHIVSGLAHALMFACQRHAGQVRQGAGNVPYINHPVAVLHILAHDARMGDDSVLLKASALHDLLEDTETTYSELELHFGSMVANLVQEVTVPKGLEGEAKRAWQVEHAAQSSPSAKVLKLADRLANLRELRLHPPGWTQERITAYIEQSHALLNVCRGQLRALDDLVAKELTLHVKSA